MTLAVVDASVALKLFIAEVGSAEAEEIQRTHDLIAPDLVLPELLNALWKARRLGLVGAEQARQIAAAIAQPFFAFVPSEELLDRAWAIAVALDHPAYDAFYIALAERERCVLFTADERLTRKTRRTSFTKLVKMLKTRR
ncbi:MAG TPA: type II toxin-antitoxin system VapC family toxin [Rhizomicrobium sp.]|nr:type II toxin-antitoxin system VapC family toxin [Rhizomicrobium sp.]